ncbi:MAG: hypothetical protein WCK83_10045 [Burkholderiales bacterium]
MTTKICPGCVAATFFAAVVLLTAISAPPNRILRPSFGESDHKVLIFGKKKAEK